MLNVFTDRTDFDLGIDDHGLSGDKDINIYVLDEDMRALSLMEAFRACRYDPLRTYYYIPKTESNFSRYATESIKRGTVNVFSDLEELRDSLREKGITFTYDHSLVDFLTEKSFSRTYGARNLRRTIQKELEDPMATKIINSYETPITHIQARAENGKVQLEDGLNLVKNV